MQQEDGIALAGLGHVHPQTIRKIDEPVLDTGNVGESGVLIHARQPTRDSMTA